MDVIKHNDDTGMPPPAVRRPANSSSSMKNRQKRKVVLAEDDYVDALGRIIERDYFPETAKLKDLLKEIHEERSRRRNALVDDDLDFDDDDEGHNVDVSKLTIGDFFRRYTSEDNESFEDLHQKDVAAHRRKYHWAYEPALAIRENGEPEAQQQKPGMLMLYYMGDKVLSVKERLAMDEILDGPKVIGDDRPNGTDSWNFRVRNQLLFPPELEDSRDTCRVDGKSSNLQIGYTNPLPLIGQEKLGLIEAGDAQGETSSSSSNPYVGNASREGKVIQKANTHINAELALLDPTVNLPLEAIEPPHTPSIFSDDFSQSDVSSEPGDSGNYVANRKYSLVSMTPSPAPESEDFLPMMTYGHIFSMPQILDPSPDIRAAERQTSSSLGLSNTSLLGGAAQGRMSLEGPAFSINETPRRETLAHSLDARGRRRRASAPARSGVLYSSLGTPGGTGQCTTAADDLNSMSSIVATKSVSSRRSSTSRLSTMSRPSLRSEAAEKLAAKISTKITQSQGSDLRAPFGGSFNQRKGTIVKEETF